MSNDHNEAAQCFGLMFNTIRSAQAILDNDDTYPELQQLFASVQERVIKWKESSDYLDERNFKPNLRLIK